MGELVSHNPDPDHLRREFFCNKNVRYLGYNFLKDVRYKGEPVVPKIVAEGVEFGIEKCFYVESYNCLDFRQIVNRDHVPVLDKLKILRHVVGQLEEIDKAGLVLFDRAGRNTMVLSYGEAGISTRQVDLEEFYDRASDSIFAETTQLTYEKDIHICKLLGFDLWSEAVRQVARDASITMYGQDVYVKQRGVFEKYEYFIDRGNTWFKGKKLLPILRSDIERVMYEVGKIEGSPKVQHLQPVRH